MDFLDPDNPVPFEELIAPIVMAASEKLTLPFSKITIERQLLKKLSGILAPTLFNEFSEFRHMNTDIVSIASAGETSADTGSKTLYRRFTAYQSADHLNALFANYPVVERLVKVAVEFWTENILKLLRDLKTDLQELESTFNEGAALGKIRKIESGLSEEHNGGKTVSCIHFENNLKLVYKPRNLESDKAFYDFSRWVNRTSGLLPIEPLTILAKKDHGWTEFIEYTPCDCLQDVRDYYKRCGMMICLIWVLEGADFHARNIIAKKSSPMLIDIETLPHSRKEQFERMIRTSFDHAMEKSDIMHSVIRTGLLPSMHVIVGGKRLVTAGFHDCARQKNAYPLRCWKNINADSMEYASMDSELERGKNLPTFRGRIMYPEGFIDEITMGFQEVYGFFLRNRTLLLSSSSPLNRFKDLKTKFAYGSGGFYSQILQRSFNPKYMKDEEIRDGFFDVIQKFFLENNEALKKYRAIAFSEKSALNMTDIPFFRTNSSSRHLFLGDGTILRNFFQKTGYETIIAKIDRLSATDMADQVHIIRKSYHADGAPWASP
jgi:type 2 lantibiotic biosynthesis protein LanM